MTDPAAKRDVEPSGFFVLRTPLRPFHDLTAWGEGLEAPAADDAGLDQALANDRATQRARLVAYVDQPEIREALFVASPSLEEAIPVWRSRPESERGQRVERALVRYLCRLAGRPTPFGLFAGCSLGTIGEATRLEISGRAEYRRHTRLDTDYLFALVDALARDAALRPAFRYRPNSTLYRIADRLRYVEARVTGTVRSHHLVAVDASQALETVLARARDGAGYQELITALVDDTISRAEAEEFVGAVIDSQLLLPDIAVPVTGEEPIHALANGLVSREPTAAIGRALGGARAGLAAFDAAGVGISTSRYRALAQALEPLPAKLELSHLFQVDMTKPAPGATLGGAVLDEILGGVALLHRLARPNGHDSLHRFRDAFRARYEEREVPLVEALDEEAGIGFEKSRDASSLLRELPVAPAATESVSWGPREALLLRKLSDALGAGRQEIALEPGDIEALAAKGGPPLPDALAVSATVAASSEQALAAGEFRVFLRGFSGPSGGELFGRFCHADHALRRRVEEHLRAEEERGQDAVFAEIVHLPEGRLGNILLRPVLRSHEIAYLGTSGAPAARQIPVTDLRVSLVGGEIVLRSARLGKRVLPRLTTAHNFRLGLGLYHFLCALQRQGVAARGGWDWHPLSRAPFLPRVRSGRLVLSRARWHAHQDELERLGRGDSPAQFREVQAWRARRGLPRWVVLSDGDNTLPLDLSSPLAVDSFVHLVREREEATLEELFPPADELCARGPEGQFVHELVIPLLARKREAARGRVDALTASVPPPAAPARVVPRSYPPLSAWLYVKLYSGTATADDVLRDVVAPLVRRVMARGLASCWFFVRYSDPDPHLRLRFRGSAATLEREVWPRLRKSVQPLLDQGCVWRLVRDTYEREVERYGGPGGIELAEEFFHADSEAVLAIVERLERSDAGLDERWRIALSGMHLLLDDLGLGLDARLLLMQRLRRAFANEQGLDRAAQHHLGDRYRKERRSLEALLDSAACDGPLPGVRQLRRRSQRWKAAARELTARAAAGRLSATIPELAASYLHMHANRLLRSAHREQEALLYDFLARHYESERARQDRHGPAAAVTSAR